MVAVAMVKGVVETCRHMVGVATTYGGGGDGKRGVGDLKTYGRGDNGKGRIGNSEGRRGGGDLESAITESIDQVMYSDLVVSCVYPGALEKREDVQHDTPEVYPKLLKFYPNLSSCGLTEAFRAIS
ncbi:hypothetical protein RJ639_008886 [Escallonia herrerae]|uniref:Uncharacterized protein n=1 Tax=Escallonia herrerae TaxID=1293975 RepID=A0AA88VZA7_9ASTE|nr:hypothetical protein RJ639_008886 [Escallonia herrerae]